MVRTGLLNEIKNKVQDDHWASSNSIFNASSPAGRFFQRNRFASAPVSISADAVDDDAADAAHAVSHESMLLLSHQSSHPSRAERFRRRSNLPIRLFVQLECWPHWLLEAGKNFALNFPRSS